MGLSNDLSCEAGSLSCCCPTPTGVFNQRFEALFPHAGALGCEVCFAPCRSSQFICERVWGHRVLPTALPAPFSATLSPALSVYLCANVGPQCLLVVGQPGSSHTPPVWVLPQPRESSPPRCPSPPLLPVWMNGYFLFSWCWSPLLFDSLSVLVVRGGAVCLPTPPSWFSPGLPFF